jgi:hypothetical protein
MYMFMYAYMYQCIIFLGLKPTYSWMCVVEISLVGITTVVILRPNDSGDGYRGTVLPSNYTFWEMKHRSRNAT